MVVKAINSANFETQKNNKQTNRNLNPNNKPSFKGMGNPIVAVADGLDAGGFIASFIAQDAFGMALPRIAEGVNRRPVNPETGKKEGPYNWAFARREGIREILSGPSAFIIPAFILKFVKKYSGTANNVPVNMIQFYGNNFRDFLGSKEEPIKAFDDVATLRKDFYKNLFKNVLKASTNNGLKAEELEELATSYMQRTIEIENVPEKLHKNIWQKIAGKKVDGSPEDLTDLLLEDFMKLKKKHVDASNDPLIAVMDNNGKDLQVPFKKMLSTLKDFTDDAIDTTVKVAEKHKENFKVEDYIKHFTAHRSGSRIITNAGMWGAVVGFYALIPKLYSLGLKGKNPAFMTENTENTEKQNNTPTANNEVKQNETKQTVKTEEINASAQKTTNQEEKKEVSFQGKGTFFTDTAERVLKSDKLNNILGKFEFDNASMSVMGMLTLLFGFCLPTRLANAPDKYDVKETLTRDITSFGAILFAAKAIERGFSDIFAKITGLALNTKTPDQTKNLWNRIKSYFSPFNGVNVLTNTQLASKYTNLQDYKDGISGFFDFLTNNGGNIKKVLLRNKEVADNAKIIVGEDIKNASLEKITNAFKNITTDDAKQAEQNIINIFKDKNNPFVKAAKTRNSLFTFLSTIVLVPSFMIWLARKCDKMTRDARAKDLAEQKEAEAAQKTAQTKNTEQISQVQNTVKVATAKPTMEGFLNK